MSRLVSIIVPVFNEAENIRPLLARLDQTVAAIGNRKPGFAFEVVITDNHSTDGTFDILRAALAEPVARPYALRAFRFAKNIGFQKSILVGYGKAAGDAVVQIDADLQDPPELIEDFIEKWQAGYQVVYGIRRSRNEGFLITFMRRQFYRLIDRISEEKLPHDAGDFRLVDRSLVDVVLALRDHDPYLRGLFASLGRRQIGVPYDRGSRERGSSKFRLRDLVRLSWDGITNHSIVPLRISSYLALAITLFVSSLAAVYLGVWALSGATLPLGFLTQVLLQLGGIAVLAFLIGIQGEYIARIYAQVKEKPLAIVEERVASGPGAAAPGEEKIEVLWTGRTPATSAASTAQRDGAE